MDLPEVLLIEKCCFPDPWTEQDFRYQLRQRNCIGMVVEDRGIVVGYMVYELHKSELRLLNIAADPDFQRQGVGKLMIKRLKDKLSQQRRERVCLEVIESNVAAQVFFRSMGFVATSVLRNWFEDLGMDAYHLVYSLVGSPVSFQGSNRISEGAI
jgi:ribosomal-protein-alanine N-acetyltransferase